MIMDKMRSELNTTMQVQTERWRRIEIRKILVALVFCALLFTGCGKSDIAKTYNQSEKDGILMTYYEMNDGTWQCDDISYQFRLELDGRMPNAEADSYYVVLTDNENLTFEDVSKSLYGSLLEDSKIMEGSIIVEMR